METTSTRAPVAATMHGILMGYATRMLMETPWATSLRRRRKLAKRAGLAVGDMLPHDLNILSTLVYTLHGALLGLVGRKVADGMMGTLELVQNDFAEDVEQVLGEAWDGDGGEIRSLRRSSPGGDRGMQAVAQFRDTFHLDSMAQLIAVQAEKVDPFDHSVRPVLRVPCTDRMAANKH